MSQQFWKQKWRFGLFPALVLIRWNFYPAFLLVFCSFLIQHCTDWPVPSQGGIFNHSSCLLASSLVLKMALALRLSDAVLGGSCSSRRNIFGYTGTSLLLLSSLPARLSQNRLDMLGIIPGSLQTCCCVWIGLTKPGGFQSAFSSHLTSASYLTLQDLCQCPGACGSHWFQGSLQWLQDSNILLCASLIRFLRCFSLFLCYHTGLWPRSQRAYQAAKVEFDVCCPLKDAHH